MSASFLSKLLSPATRIMSRFRFSQKLVLLSMMFVLPMMAVSWMLWQEKSGDIGFSANEMQGTRVLTPLIELQNAVQAHGGDMALLLGHGQVSQDSLAKDSADAEQAIADLDAWISHEGARSGLSGDWASIRSGWSALRQRGTDDNAVENLKAHTALVGDIIAFTDRVADASKLSLDPIMSSYALADLSTGKVPTALSALGELTNGAAARIRAGTVASAQERTEIAVLAKALDIAFDAIPDDLHRALAEDPSLTTALSARLDAATQAKQTFERLIREKIIDASAVTASDADIQAQGANAKAAVLALDKAVIPELARLLNDRQRKDLQDRRFAVVAVSAGLLIAIYLFLGFQQSIGRALQSLRGAAGQLARNEFPDSIDLHSRDELQDIGNEMMTVSRALKGHAAEQAEHLARQTKLTAGLANAGIGVMIANADGIIEYVNESGIRYMEASSEALRATVPDFDARKLVGRSFDVFHQNPQHQRQLLAGLTKPFHSKVRIGGRHFDLNVSPVMGEDGQRLGAVVEWIDRTAQVEMDARVAELVHTAANGDFSRRLEVTHLEGEFRSRAEGFNQLLDSVETGLDEIERVMSAVADGDLTQSITREFNGQLGTLSNHINATVGQLAQIVGQIKASADSVQTAAREIATGNSDLSGRTEQQAAQIEETASSMEELTSTVKRNADNARQASQLAGSASETAGRGGQIVAQVIADMSAIQDASRQVAEIVNVIDGIAFQTNILALNAAVEAARAGDQGRGFAVVAGEVRSLAQRAASSAKEIKGLIANSMDKVNAGSERVNAAGRTMDEIVTGIQRVTTIMSEISEASREQSAGIEQINTAIVQMDEVTQQNAALVEEASASARSLEEQATGLSAIISAFRTQQDSRATGAGQGPSGAATQPVGASTTRPTAAPASSPRKRAPARSGMTVAPHRSAAIAAEGAADSAARSATAWQEF